MIKENGVRKSHLLTLHIPFFQSFYLLLDWASEHHSTHFSQASIASSSKLLLRLSIHNIFNSLYAKDKRYLSVCSDVEGIFTL